MLHRFRMIYICFFKWFAIAVLLQFGFFLFCGLFAGAAQTPDAQPTLGHTFFIKVCYRTGHCSTGYVKPWIGEIYNFQRDWMFIDLGVLFGLALFGVALRGLDPLDP